MTRSHNDDCDQWCSSIESEETCSMACHAVTGRYCICSFWNWSVNISSVVYFWNLCNKVMDHHVLFIIIHPQGSPVTGGLVRLAPPTPPPPPWSRPWCTATAPAPRTRPPAPTRCVTPWRASTPASVHRYQSWSLSFIMISWSLYHYDPLLWSPSWSLSLCHACLIVHYIVSVMIAKNEVPIMTLLFIMIIMSFKLPFSL